MMFELHIEGRVIGSGDFDALKQMTQNVEVEYAIYQIFKSKINLVPVECVKAIAKAEAKEICSDIKPSKYLNYKDAERAANMRIRGKTYRRIWKELHTTETHLRVSLEIFDKVKSEKEYTEKITEIKSIRQYAENTF